MSLAALTRQSAHQRFTVADPADAGAARRAVVAIAERLGAEPAAAARAGQATTELATNLLRHALPGGWILARPLPPDSVEVLAVDRGPGIADVPGTLGDRPGSAPVRAPSHGAGLGCGLAAVRRAASRFDLHSDSGGTVVLAVFDAHSRPPEEHPPAGAAARHWAGVSTSIDEQCGDAWAVVELPTALTAVVVDGLGHGAHASVAAEAAIHTLSLDPGDLAGFLPRANQALRHTRGAGLAACLLDERSDELWCLSVGNINGRVARAGNQRGLVSYSGTLGMRAEPPKSPLMVQAWPAGATLVLWSDGLDSRIDLTAVAGLLDRDPAVVAAVLHRDHTLEHDDATVLVVRRPATR